MNRFPSTLRPLFAAAVVSMLAACGGGGQDPILGFDSSATTGTPTVPAGTQTPPTGAPIVPPGTVLANGAVALASISTFGIYGGSAGMTNEGILTVINGDIGTTGVSTTLTGFHDAGPGCIYTENAAEHRHGQWPDLHRPAAAHAGLPERRHRRHASPSRRRRAPTPSPPTTSWPPCPAGPIPASATSANLTLAPGTYTAAAGTFCIQGGNLTLDAPAMPTRRGCSRWRPRSRSEVPARRSRAA